MRSKKQGVQTPLTRNVFIRGNDGQILKEWRVIVTGKTDK